MTALLAIDAASSRLSVAVRAASGAVVERELVGARRHGGALAPLVRDALADAAVELGTLGGIAVSDGPGSFTGLRVAAAFAQGLARTARLPLWTASTLMVRAVGARALGGSPAEVVAGLGSALRGELYVGVYRFGAAGLETRLAPRVLGAGAPLPIEDRIDAVAGDLDEEDLDRWAWTRSARRIVPPAGWPRARLLIELVGVPGGARRIAEPAGWEPTYGRPAEAQAKWERAHGRPLVVPSRDA